MIIVGLNLPTDNPIHLATTPRVKNAGATIYTDDNTPVATYDPKEKVWRVSEDEKYSEIHYI